MISLQSFIKGIRLALCHARISLGKLRMKEEEEEEEEEEEKEEEEAVAFVVVFVMKEKRLVKKIL